VESPEERSPKKAKPSEDKKEETAAPATTTTKEGGEAANKEEDPSAKEEKTAAAAVVEEDNEPKVSNLSDYEKCSIFPQKLMQLLKNDEAPDAIWWLDDGASFAIEPEKFTTIMNKVSRTSKKKVKLDSILRNLYRW